MLRLESWLPFYLAKYAEYRMGCHKVVATLNNGGTEKGLILNEMIFVKESEIQAWMSWDSIVSEAAKSSLIVSSVVVIPREPETLHGVRQITLANEKNARLALKTLTAASTAYGSQREQLLTASRQYEMSAKSEAAKDAPVTLTAAGEIFKRFCAFANDRRVTPGKGLEPGTFATTKEDADAYVKTGTDAVARYALPNPKPASNVFTIKPAEDTDLQRGVAQPAYGQPGGGVEVIFVNGLPDGTVTGPTTIPDK